MTENNRVKIYNVSARCAVRFPHMDKAGRITEHWIGGAGCSLDNVACAVGNTYGVRHHHLRFYRCGDMTEIKEYNGEDILLVDYEIDRRREDEIDDEIRTQERIIRESTTQINALKMSLRTRH
jgi:hypothetical protein